MNIQTKILMGIGAFVATMLLVGWIAINEPARMDVFTQQWHGRSIEKGAELFQANCSRCHGLDAKGLAAVAPALDNPMLFLKENPAKVANDQLKADQTQLKTLQTAKTSYDANVAALSARQTQCANPANDDEKARCKTDIDSLQGKIAAYDPKTPDNIDAQNTKIKDDQAKVDALAAQGWEPTRAVRLEEQAWTGSLPAYIKATLISGRPGSAANGRWPNPMPFWAQSSGGPLRDDQLDNLTDYLMNFQDTAVKMTPKDVNQQFKPPYGAAVQTDKKVLGSDFDVLAAGLDFTGGDATVGSQLYHTTLPCAGCHEAVSGPAHGVAPTAGTYTRVLNIRLKDEANKNKTAEQYLAESIIKPNAYIVPGAPTGLMPSTFGDQLDMTDLKNLIAFLKTTQTK